MEGGREGAFVCVEAKPFALNLATSNSLDLKSFANQATTPKAPNHSSKSPDDLRPSDVWSRSPRP